MIQPDPSLTPDWDEDNINHIWNHGIRPEQVEELYYNDGPLPTLAIRNKRQRGRLTEYRYRLWGTDASGFFMDLFPFVLTLLTSPWRNALPVKRGFPIRNSWPSGFMNE